MDRPCTQCGGKLAGVAFERMVVCAYCQTSQPNLDCLPVGQEVVVDDGGGYALATVTACRGPDDIDLSGIAAPLKLEDVTPVTRAPETLAAGTLVYCKGMMGWERTWTASAAKRGSVTVKHTDAAFQDDFFNREAPLVSVRVACRPSEQHRRTATEALLDEARADPVGTGMRLVFKLAFLGFGLLCAAIVLFTIFAH